MMAMTLLRSLLRLNLLLGVMFPMMTEKWEKSMTD
jgi:hypothetical protein